MPGKGQGSSNVLMLLPSTAEYRIAQMTVQTRAQTKARRHVAYNQP